jgi:hypothetical protein
MYTGKKIVKTSATVTDYVLALAIFGGATLLQSGPKFFCQICKKSGGGGGRVSIKNLWELLGTVLVNTPVIP